MLSDRLNQPQKRIPSLKRRHTLPDTKTKPEMWAGSDQNSLVTIGHVFQRLTEVGQTEGKESNKWQWQGPSGLDLSQTGNACLHVPALPAFSKRRAAIISKVLNEPSP